MNGAFTLEAFSLAPDPVNKRPVPAPALAMKSRLADNAQG